MTYFDRSEISTEMQPSPEHATFILEIILKASQIWTAGAPKLKTEFANDLVNRMKWKKRAVIEAAFNFLKENHDTNFFPKPAKWEKALEYAEKNYRAPHSNLDDFSLEDFRGNKIAGWERKIVEFVESFSEDNELAKTAKKEKWWGYIYDNGVIPEMGLANYMAAIFTRQYFILKIIPNLTTKISIKQRGISEFTSDQYSSFNEWLHSKEFFQKVKDFNDINFNLYREEDVKIIQDFCMTLNPTNEKLKFKKS